jgi:hypothetical protein
MVPYVLEEDYKGRLYTKDPKVLLNYLTNVDKREIYSFRKSDFYRFDNTNYYIIKKPPNLTFFKRITYMNMLTKFLAKQDKIELTELPIGYYRDFFGFAGLIIRYYENGISLEDLLNLKDINFVKKYYNHSSDSIENIFLLLEDFFMCLKELEANRIYYYDIKPQNIIICDNRVRIIDFDPSSISFKRRQIINMNELVIIYYIELLEEIMKAFEINNEDTDSIISRWKCYGIQSIEGFEELINKIKKVINGKEKKKELKN